MKYRVTFLAGAAVGYLFGTRAGRERYEQIKRASRRVADNPTVQEAAGVVRARAGELAETTRGKVQDKLGDRIPQLRKNDKPLNQRTSQRANQQTPTS